jgi:hypothetical protein
MSLMNKRLPWFKTMLLVAMACGFAAYWFVDAWLEPGPQIFTMDQLIPHEVSFHDYLFDLSHRWLAVHVSAPEKNTKDDMIYRVFDLDQQGRQIKEFAWKRLLGIFPTSQQRYGGMRLVYHLANGDLIVMDQSFVEGISQTHHLGNYRPESIRNILIAEEGQRVIVLHHLPMWPWCMLCNTGQPPFMNLVPFSQMCLADVWDASTRQRVNQFVISPPDSGNQLLSSDGQWLVQLEAEAETIELSTVTKSFKVQPATPRGVQIINTTTGERRVILEKPYDKDGYGAYEGKIVGEQLMLFHGSKTLEPGQQFNIRFSSRDYKNRSSTMYNLATDKESLWSWPAERTWMCEYDLPRGLQASGWLAYSFVHQQYWPEWLGKIARWMNYDLDKRNPLGNQWDVTFFDADTKAVRYRKAIRFPIGSENNSNQRNISKPNKSASLILEVFASKPLEQYIYRWKVPFTIYSLWWARAVGVLVVFLIVACYGMIIRRWQRAMDSHTPT